MKFILESVHSVVPHTYEMKSTMPSPTNNFPEPPSSLLLFPSFLSMTTMNNILATHKQLHDNQQPQKYFTILSLLGPT